MREYTDGEVAVIGLGISGVAVARLLRHLGATVYVSDAGRSAALEVHAAQLRGEGCHVDLGGHDISRVQRAKRVVVSPGVPPTAPPIAAARGAGIEVISEIEVALDTAPHLRYIAVTGTNGKTTVTALVAHLLSGLGLEAVATGNYGLPLSEVVLRQRLPAWCVIELSSFQLHDTPSVRPQVGVLTNLAPDHLDRYASVDEYYADKAQLFANASRSSRWVVNADDPASLAMMDGVPGVEFRFSSAGRFADAFLDRSHDALILEDDRLLPQSDLALLGIHNVANALAAALAVVVADPTHDTFAGRAMLARALRSFRALPHRLQPLGEVNGVLFINDSKSTNVASTRVAVASMTRPTVLLLGGRHKGEPYHSLLDEIRAHCRVVVAYGEARDLVEGDLASGTRVVSVTGPFADVMRRARELAEPGDAVLLSPACSSYDMFNNYVERGTAFASAAGLSV